MKLIYILKSETTNPIWNEYIFNYWTFDKATIPHGILHINLARFVLSDTETKKETRSSMCVSCVFQGMGDRTWKKLHVALLSMSTHTFNTLNKS